MGPVRKPIKFLAAENNDSTPKAGKVIGFPVAMSVALAA